ncbi:hypothetical protein DTO282F9_1558 [Paecilomyces variotii]|nr:hypothetical protein DTO282F9_1558 [Paecilomyces variotii]
MAIKSKQAEQRFLTPKTQRSPPNPRVSKPFDPTAYDETIIRELVIESGSDNTEIITKFLTTCAIVGYVRSSQLCPNRSL